MSAFGEKRNTYVSQSWPDHRAGEHPWVIRVYLNTHRDAGIPGERVAGYIEGYETICN
jgi:hypothetical protein